jgi:hypothetical protein
MTKEPKPPQGNIINSQIRSHKNILPGDLKNYITWVPNKTPFIKKWNIQEEANQATPFDE